MNLLNVVVIPILFVDDNFIKSVHDKKEHTTSKLHTEIIAYCCTKNIATFLVVH